MTIDDIHKKLKQGNLTGNGNYEWYQTKSQSQKA